ncbi:MAG: fumarate hydratase [Acidobacteria bacterium]|nr:fumarate hydratase [Acidobacteriota bacterium]
MRRGVDLHPIIEQTARDLYIRALKTIPDDVRRALARGLDAEVRAGEETARQVMFTIVENIQVAETEDTLVCQDTGLPVYKLRIGSRIAQSLDLSQVVASVRRGAERATAEYPLRSNTVHPLTRRNTGTNSGEGMPVVKLEFVPGGETIEINMAPKGSGSENMSFLRMLNPSEGLAGIKRFVLECVLESGARPCPPVIVGVGLGGTSDVAMTLAKEAGSFRRIGSVNADPAVAELERWLLQRINELGIGPQGLGGVTTALAVHIEWAHTHISHNPVAVNMQCWRGERATAVIDAAGSVRYAS